MVLTGRSVTSSACINLNQSTYASKRQGCVEEQNLSSLTYKTNLIQNYKWLTNTLKYISREGNVLTKWAYTLELVEICTNTILIQCVS